MFPEFFVRELIDLSNKASAFPAKSFFVKMLTKDIDMNDAILDLLDNCVDGILRTKWEKGIPDHIKNPYEGFYAEIEMNENYFVIKDNCGGIPRDIAEKYAFMMGRSEKRDESIPTVGLYGIGMKRALFKMGRNCVVTSNTTEGAFEVVITADWMDSDKDWELPIKDIPIIEDAPYGTTITVTDLHENIARLFANQGGFQTEFNKVVARYYSFIISKGFKIKINGIVINPVPMKLLFDVEDKELSPFVYQATIDDVDVLLEVGLYKAIPTEEEMDEEQIIKRTKDDSGWTIVCNDRVVLYKDKTILTGWGEANVPNYHSQFNGITGIVTFKTNYPDRLPVNTTKRGVDASSELYLKIKNQMRVGTKLFTDYTNNWKKNTDQQREKTKKATLFDVTQVFSKVPEASWKIIRSEPDNIEKVYRPNLPKPESNSRIQINFVREKEEVKKVAEFLFDDPDARASQVGNECFIRILRSIDE